MSQTSTKQNSFGSVVLERVCSRPDNNYRYFGNEYRQLTNNLREYIPYYYPFGSSLPTRSWSDVSRQYRYGFNGSELTELRNQYYTEYRTFNTSIARWLSLDKITIPSVSSYVFVENNPINYSDPSGLAKEKPIKIKYSTTADHFNVILARTFNANFRAAFRTWKTKGIVDKNGTKQTELFFSRSKNYKHKLTDLTTDEKAEGHITHINYKGIFSKSTRYKIINTTYEQYYHYETNPDGPNTGLNKKAKGYAVLHTKIFGDGKEFSANNSVSGVYIDKTESFTVDGGSNGKVFTQGTFDEGEKVEVTGTYFDVSEQNRDAFNMDGLGNSGNNSIYVFDILVRSYTDPVILKVPTNVFGGLKWRKSEIYSPKDLETIFKNKTRQATN